MADNGMNYEQALDVLQRMHKAAPPIAATKLAGVIDLLQRLKTGEHDAAADDAPPTPPTGQERRMLTRNTGNTPPPKTPPNPMPGAPPSAPPTVPSPPSITSLTPKQKSQQRTVEVPRLAPNPPPVERPDSDSQSSRSFSRLLGRLLKEGIPPRPSKQTPPTIVSGTVDYVFQDFDLDQYDIENMPDPSDSRVNLPDVNGGGVPDTGALFSDLPEFPEDSQFDPDSFTLDAVLGLGEGGAPAASHAQPAASGGDLLSILGLTGSLDPDTFDQATSDPAPDLFQDIPPDPRRTTSIQRPVLTEDIPSNVGMEDVTGLLKDADAIDSKASGDWHVTDVLRDLGVERPNPPIPSAPQRQPHSDAAFDLNALYANFIESDAAANAPDADFDPAEAFQGSAGWGATGMLTDPNADVDDSPSQYGVTGLLADATDEDEGSNWGKTTILGDDEPVPLPENTWGMTARLDDLPPDPNIDPDEIPPSRLWGATSIIGADAYPGEPLPADPDEMPSSRLWGATANFADDALLDDVMANEASESDEMPSARLWDAHAPLADVSDASESDSWLAHAPTMRDRLMRVPDLDEGLTDIEPPQDTWMVEHGLVDDAGNSPFDPNAYDPTSTAANTDNLADFDPAASDEVDQTVDQTRARWSEPPTWLVDEPLSSDPTRYSQRNLTASSDTPVDNGAWSSGRPRKAKHQQRETDRLDDAAWNASYQPQKQGEGQTGSLYNLFDGGVSEDGGLVPDEYGIYDANVIGGQEALENLVAFAVGESPSQIGGDAPPDLPGPAALLTNVREVLKPSLLLLRAQTALLRDRVDETLDERDSEMVRLMQDNAESALTLLESLEMIMQLSEGSLEIGSDVFSSIDLLREAGERMQDRARTYKHRITVHLDRGLPRLRADYRRTLSILTDLMENAVRYTPEGGSSRITVDNLGGYVLFTVADNGIGLTEQEMYFIGQPFWRALHQPLVRAHRGTGLRLYLARRILEMQGGELFFSGETGKGSTFSFTVPVAQAMLG